MWLLMCPKADKGASSGYWVACLFVIEICLLVVGTKEQTRGPRVSPGGKWGGMLYLLVGEWLVVGWYIVRFLVGCPVAG